MGRKSSGKAGDGAKPREDSHPIHMRVTPEEAALIQRAMPLDMRKSQADFCRVAAVLRARQILRDNGEEVQ